MSDSINISKIGTRYENIYYYKQKVVNWEYVSSKYYECDVSTINTNHSIASKFSASLYSAYQYVNIPAITTYITEESYADDSFYYNITFQNVATNSPPVLVESYDNINDDLYSIYSKINLALVDSTPITIKNIYTRFKNKLILPFNDRIDIQCHTIVPRLSYKDNFNFYENSYNLVQNITPGIDPHHISAVSNGYLYEYSEIKRVKTATSLISTISFNKALKCSKCTSSLVDNKMLVNVPSDTDVVEINYSKSYINSKCTASYINSTIIVS